VRGDGGRLVAGLGNGREEEKKFKLVTSKLKQWFA
jgi:hypothetical protein